MSGTPDQSCLSPDRQSLEPDTFWELVEKLLLRSSRDERLRHGHNLSLATMCRGYAISKVTRDRKQTSTQIKDAQTSLSAKSHKKLKTQSTDILSEKKPKAKVHAVQNKTAGGTKSECNLKDHDVVYVKDTEIPASERLWRFAIKNRKQKEGGEKSINLKSGVPRNFPSARSNKAIFEGLRQRLEEAKKAELEQKEADKKQESKLKQKRRKKRQKAVSHSCDATNKNGATVTTRKHCSKSVTNTSEENSKHQKPSSRQTSSTQSVASSSSHVSSASEQTVTSSDDSQNTNAQVRSVTPEQMEAKKYLYDNVLKKRLHCGNQLETLNKEIINKKVNPRLVLSRETTRKYAELKTEYLKLCYQESSLRHQIVMLQAEIYMMQNKNFHKRPAAIKTITLNSETAKVPQHLSMAQEKEKDNSRLTQSSEDVLLFPRLKAPRPLITAMPKNGSEKKNEVKDDKSANKCLATNLDETEQLPSLEVLRPRGVCSLYSLTTSLAERYPKR